MGSRNIPEERGVRRVSHTRSRASMYRSSIDGTSSGQLPDKVIAPIWLLLKPGINCSSVLFIGIY